MYIYIVFFTLFFYWFLSKFRKHDKFPPGPPKLPFIGSIPFLAVKGGFIHTVKYVVDKYGPVSGIYLGSQPAIIISDYNILKELHKRDDVSARAPNPPINETRPGWHTVGEESKGCAPGVISTSGKYWREQRRFLLKNLKDFGFGKTSMESIIQDEMAKLCSKLARFPQNEPLNLNHTMNISVLNALWSLLVGEKLDLEDTKLVAIVEMFDELFKDQSTIAMAIISFLPHPSLAKLPILRHLTAMDKGFKTLGATQDFIEPYITEHKRTLDPENIRDFVDLMLLEIDNTSDKESSFYGETGYYALFNDLIDMFLAGMETTSSSLLWTFLYLLHHPEVQAKVHQELDEVVGRNRFPSLEDRPKLHYTNAVLLESLRAAALVGPGVPHYSTQDVPLGDFIIPKHTVIFGSLYHAMNDPKHFPDPHKFHPERFLDEQGHFVPNERVIPFGIGKRVCLGQTLAEKEFYIFFAGFMQQFELQKDQSKELPPYGMDETFQTGFLRTCPEYTVILKHRLNA